MEYSLLAIAAAPVKTHVNTRCEFYLVTIRGFLEASRKIQTT
jgi:hypothetical protein